MKKIIIVGMGGLGAELYDYMRYEIESSELIDVELKGYIDIEDKKFDFEYLGTEDTCEIGENDYFLIGISTEIRKDIILKLKARGAKFYTYVHSSAFVSGQLGEGCVVCPNAMVTTNAIVGDFCVLNMYSSVSHDSIIGDFGVLSPYATINGNCSIGKNVFMGTRASITRGHRIGNDCVLSAHSCAFSNMKDGEKLR